MTEDAVEREEQRLDKWLWHARLVKSRSLAARLIEDGRIRVNRRRVLKPSTCVKCGDVLTASLNGQVRVVRVVAIAVRRGPASEAQTLYAEAIAPADPAPSDSF